MGQAWFGVKYKCNNFRCRNNIVDLMFQLLHNICVNQSDDTDSDELFFHPVTVIQVVTIRALT